MAITAKMVKELRVATGAGMMDCKKALTEVNGDLEAAIEFLRKKGMAGADKKAGRIAAEGVIAIAISADAKSATAVEVNCETDFVAKGEEFNAFADEVAAIALASNHTNVESLMGAEMASGVTVDIRRREMIAKIGENMAISRIENISAETLVGKYKHGEKIGVLVALSGGNNELAKDIAMHIAAVKPQAISADELDPAMIEKERKFQIDQAKESGKPDNIIEKMIEGRMRKFLQDNTLLGQGFVKDPEQTIEKLLETNKASVTGFHRLEVGAGIVIEEMDFASEVAAAAAAAVAG